MDRLKNQRTKIDPFDLSDPWLNYIHNGRNGQINGNTEKAMYSVFNNISGIIMIIMIISF